MSRVLDQAVAEDMPVSVDSFLPDTQRFAAAHGAAYLNDIQGFPNAARYEELAGADCRLIVMHSVQRTGPATKVLTDSAAMGCQVRARAYARRGTGVLAYAEPSLPPAGLEVDAVLAEFDDGRAVSAQPGVKDELASHIADFNHLHLATHGVYRLQEPMESSILVGGECLFMRELIARQIIEGGRLTFLSACQSGVTDIRTRRDEVIVLPSAGIQSGASGVVATLWPVDDAAMFLVVRKFYSAYAATADDPAKASATARTHLRELTAGEILDELQELPPSLGSLRLRRRGYTPFSDPVFWAPFVFFGA